MRREGKIRKIVRQSNSLKFKISMIALLFVSVQLINNSIFPMIIRPLNIPIQILLYLSMIIVFVSSYPKLTFQPKILLLVVGTGVSLLVNQVDSKYGSGVRWGLWLLLLSSVGPMFSSKLLLDIRSKILQYFLTAFVYITVISFFYAVLGLPNIGRGNFAGLMNQSMVLGPVAAISGIYTFYKYLINNKPTIKVFYFIISIISMLVVLLASSRLAFAGYIAGMIFLFTTSFRFRIIYASVILVFGFFMYSRIDDGTDKVNQSIDKGMVEKGTTNSREILWNNRILEFKSNPVFGVGFSTQDDSLIEKVDGAESGSAGGRIEPGSGYLMILSMTGIFGFSMFMWFVYYIFINKRFWREIFKNESYKISIFAFFIVHFVGEGYIYSAGSMLSALFWLMIGVTFPYSNIKKHLLKKINRT